jgi:hypothetical protein
MNRQDEIGPYWQDEDDWLCMIEFLPGDDPEGRLFGADIVGYLVGYAQLTNTRVLALIGEPVPKDTLRRPNGSGYRFSASPNRVVRTAEISAIAIPRKKTRRDAESSTVIEANKIRNM